MTAKDYLMQAWQIDKRIEARIEERERLLSLLTSPRTAKLTGMPRGGGGDWTNAIISVSDLSDSIAREIMELCRIKREVNESIDAVEDIHQRQILELRYRLYQSWGMIAKETGYSVRNVHEMHGKALLRIKALKKL